MIRFQLMGEAGYTQPCLVALDAALSGPSNINRATVVTKNENEHLFILWVSEDHPQRGTIIPTGFASGYAGEGARGFSLALCMLHEQGIPIDHMTVPGPVFDQIDGGHFPNQWQRQVSEMASPCEMPIPGWIFVGHWELALKRRLWRVQSWRWRNTVIQWTESAKAIDDFNWDVGDKLDSACRTLTRNSQSEHCQHVGLILRDAWTEFTRIARKDIDEDSTELGRSDVKGVIDALKLPEDISRKVRRAYNSTNALQHDLRAVPEDAVAYFSRTTEAMAGVIGACFPRQRDHRMDDLIRPN